MEVAGLADASGNIDEFIDVTTEAVNETLTPGGQFSVSGHKIRVAGHLAEDTASKVIAIIPAGFTAGDYTLEIVTQYTPGGSFLKEPRTIAFSVQLAVPTPSL